MIDQKGNAEKFEDIYLTSYTREEKTIKVL